MTKKLFSNLLILSLIAQASVGLFAFPQQTKAAGNTYYVDNTCSNNGDGSSQTCASSPGTAGPFNSIANMQAKSGGYASDDQILLKRGDTFREQLTVPSSGTSGHPITFGAYPASGALPIITGADLVTGWTAQAGAAPSTSNGFEEGTTDLCNTGNAYWTGSSGCSASATFAGNITNPVKTGTYSAGAVWTATSQNALAYHTIAQTSDNYVQVALNVVAEAGTSQLRLMSYNNGSNFVSIYAVLLSASTYRLDLYYSNSSGAQSITGSTVLTMGTWYVIETHYRANNATTGGAEYWINGTQEGSVLNQNTTQANNQPNRAYVGLNYSASGNTAGSIYFDNYQYNTSYMGPTFANVYQASVAYTPSQVFVGGVKGTSKASLGALATNGDWYYSSGTLYLYETSDPSILSIEADNRVSPVIINGKNYITLQNLDIRYGNTNINGAVSVNVATGVTLSGLSVHDNSGVAGIRFRNGGSGNTITSNTVYNNWSSVNDRGDGIDVDDNGSDSVTNNIVHDNTGQAIRLGLVQESDSNYVAYNTIYNNGSVGIGTFPADTGTTIEYNLVYNNGQLVADTFGIDMFEAGNNTIVRYNIMHDHHYVSIDAGGLRFDGGVGYSSTGSVAYGNIIYNERWGIHNLNFGGVSFYNNTVYNSGVYGIFVEGTHGGVATFRNNIVDTAGTYLMYFNGVGTISTDYNNYYPDGATAFNWNDGTISAFATWKTNSSQDAHSISTDPKFTTPGSNFSLQSTSPAIDTGTPLADAYKLGLNPNSPNSAWPSSVNTLDQTLNGAGWEMGAYVYTQSSAPTVSISAPSAGFASSSIAVTATAGATSPATISSVQFYLDGVALQSPVTNSPYTITWDTTTATNASHTLTAVATDNYTNTTTSAGVVVTVDNLGPTGTISNGNGTPTNSVTPTLNLTIADAGVGIAGAQMQFSCDAVTWSAWENYATPKTNFNVRTGAGCTDADGSKTVYVQYKDSLGNVGSSYNTGAFTLDTSASFATLSDTPASITKSTSASVTVAGTNITAYEYKLDSGSYGTETLVATPISLSSLADGSHTLSVIGKNSAGTWQVQGSATTYTWTVDTTAPVVTFTIPSTSNSLTVTFTSFSATDTNGVTGYLVNESATTPDVSDASWAGTAQTQYVFTTEGAKTLYAWAKDGVGNISTSGSGAVTVTNIHTITASVGANGSISPSGSVSVNNGSDQAFTITPNSGYHIDTVTADSVAVSATSPYTFTNVTADHTISATFAADAVVVTGGGPLVGGGNGAPVGLITGSSGGHRQDISNLLATTTTTIPGCNKGTNGFSITTGQSCSGNTGSTTTTTPPTLPKYNFTRNLSLHSTGKDVKALQQYLNANGFLIAKIGAGSSGKETTLFGTLTYKALVKYQKSLGWSGTGFFGPMTRDYINKQ